MYTTYFEIIVHTTIDPQEQFFNLLQILTHRCFLKQTSQRFSKKKTSEI